MIHPACAGSVALRSSHMTTRSKTQRDVVCSVMFGGLLALASACGGGGGDGGTTAPPPSTNTATVSGAVADEERGGVAVAGARVAIGALNTTTNQLGQFTLAGVPKGTQHVIVSAAGFDTTTWDVEIGSGTNTGTIPL